MPELDEVFFVHLLNTTAGQLEDPDKTVAMVTILGNDDPYGVFVFEASSLSITSDEENKNVTLMVSRTDIC